MTPLEKAAEAACAAIAPCWPLDRFIAVNPFWSHTDKPLPKVAGELASLSAAKLLMTRSWYAGEHRAGRLKPEHLRQAIAQSGHKKMSESHLSGLLRIDEPHLKRRPLVVDVMDARGGRELETSWREYVVERISRFCAAYFDDGQAQIRPHREDGLYATWRSAANSDQGPSLFMDLREYRSAVAALPSTADAMLLLAEAELGVPEKELAHYLTALLLDVNGWSSWCAYLRWMARLDGADDANIRELLAVRVAWDWILFRSAGEDLRIDWGHAVASWPTFDKVAHTARAEDWLLQNAVEIAWMSTVRDQLLEKNVDAPAVPTRASPPSFQAIFCIDVRSEVFRRALEAQSPDIQTLGGAGFFGVPIEYATLASDSARPQLPGLLAPKFRVTDTGLDPSVEGSRTSRLKAAQAWKAFKSGSLSSFAFVDALGLKFAASLLNETFRWWPRETDYHDHAGLSTSEDKGRTPRITARVDGQPLTLDDRCQLAESMLRTMTLTDNLAPFVLLVGHRGGTRNNPHAAGLDCGACCGQTGEVNARAAADLLNDPEVRAGLSARGIEVPATTRFVAGLHNTTTDDVTLYDAGEDLAEVRAALAKAGVAARRERAPRLGLTGLEDKELHETVIERSMNWAEVRPEWGLAGNASFIIAPRERSRHLDLGGRAFLHDYRPDLDPEGAVLEQVMLGPMVVTHWINFQYYASTVDNTRYGCGNKVLHNVVGGHLGVFEGNGGDLRIGLSLQSLHDGEHWVHAPLRLSVFIEAPRDVLDRILEKHVKLRDLVDNEWLHLFQLDPGANAIHVRRNKTWKPA